MLLAERASRISIHAPTWGATARRTSTTTRLFNFNPRTHVGCDYLCNVNKKGWHHFNPRTHVGCDALWVAAWILPKKFQSTHPRGVRRGVFKKLDLNKMISIHAPTWGATRAEVSHPWPLDNFNPRTHVGCDSRAFRSPRAYILFQSTHPRGVRRSDEGDRGVERAISIHAPTWGATI